MNLLQSIYKIKRFTTSKDRDFIKALKIYNDSIAVHSKTDTNEISAFIDKTASPNREMFFFGLYYNDIVVGYIECGYLKTTRSLIIDYFIIKDDYSINGVFYPFLSLFQQFLSSNLIEIDYYIIEVNFKSSDFNEDKESYYLRKLLFAEDFKTVDIAYSQPRLGVNNFESNLDMKLMLKSTNSLNTIRPETITAILHDIYYNHYINWYMAFMTEDEIREYEKHIQNQEKLLNEQIKNRDVIKLISNTNTVCDHYMSNNCYYNNSRSTAGYVKSPLKRSIRILKIISIPLVIFIAVLLSFAAFLLTTILEISIDKISPFFTAVSATLTGLIALFISSKNK